LSLCHELLFIAKLKKCLVVDDVVVVVVVPVVPVLAVAVVVVDVAV
jgi:hypothetical protein